LKTEPINGTAGGSPSEATSSHSYAVHVSPHGVLSQRVILYGGFSGEGITGLVLSLDPGKNHFSDKVACMQSLCLVVHLLESKSAAYLRQMLFNLM